MGYNSNNLTFDCYCEMGESERLDMDEIKYAVKNYYLLEVQLSEENYLYIRQWKDLPVKVGEYDMECGDLYLTDGKKIYDVWDGNDLEQWISKCQWREENFKKDFISLS